MAQTFFNSVRRLNFYNFKTKYINQNEAVGEHFKKQTIDDYGSIPEPSCLEYDDDMSLLAIGNKKGLIKIFGRPGFSFSSREEEGEEIVKIKFIPQTNYVISLTLHNYLSLWYMCQTTNHLIKLDTITNLSNLSLESGTRKSIAVTDKQSNIDSTYNYEQVITAAEVIQNTFIILGDIEGSLIQVKLDISRMKKAGDLTVQKLTKSVWSKPTVSNVISCNRIISKLPTGAVSHKELGSVFHISVRPGTKSQLLIGFRSFDCVLYDLQQDTIVSVLSCKVSFSSLAWQPTELIEYDQLLVSPEKMPEYKLSYRLISSHENGALVQWSLPKDKSNPMAMKSSSVFPFKGYSEAHYSITKIIWFRTVKGTDQLLFSGGLPKPDYMSKSTISIVDVAKLEPQMEVNKSICSVVFDLTSPLIDMQTINEPDSGRAKYLSVLTEEEFFIVDLRNSEQNEWPILFSEQPYLNCLHHSPISAYHFITDVSQSWLATIKKISEVRMLFDFDSSDFSSWPITGDGTSRFSKSNGKENCSRDNARRCLTNDNQSDNGVWMNDILVTGHGDGSIVFWRVGCGSCIKKMAHLTSAKLFSGCEQIEYKPENDGDADDYEILMKKVGGFDPCDDDNRLAIQLIHFTGSYLVAGGFAGQVIVWGFVDDKFENQVLEADLTTHLGSGFNWRGCKKLEVSEIDVAKKNQKSGFKPMLTLSIWPPSQITALDLVSNSSSVIVAAGTMHGVVLISCQPGRVDQQNGCVLASHCTVPKWSVAATAEAGLGDGWARRRTRELKKSLRESFRKLRRRSTKKAPASAAAIRNRYAKTDSSNAKVEIVENEIGFEERIVEDRPKETATTGLVKSVKITLSSHLKKSHSSTSNLAENADYLNLFVGTAGGHITWLQSDHTISKTGDISLVNLRPVKQYQLQHGAPVLFMALIGADGAIREVDGKGDKSQKLNQLLVVTEEQVRIYSLPTWTLRYKLRVTAQDGYRLRNGSMVALNKLNSHGDSTENMICSTNNGGQMMFLSTVNLKKKDIVQFVDRTDLMALNYISLAVCCHLDDASSCGSHGNNTNRKNGLSLAPYGVHYSGHGQVTLFKIVPRSSKMME